MIKDEIDLYSFELPKRYTLLDALLRCGSDQNIKVVLDLVGSEKRSYTMSSTPRSLEDISWSHDLVTWLQGFDDTEMLWKDNPWERFEDLKG